MNRCRSGPGWSPPSPACDMCCWRCRRSFGRRPPAPRTASLSRRRSTAMGRARWWYSLKLFHLHHSIIYWFHFKSFFQNPALVIHTWWWYFRRPRSRTSTRMMKRKSGHNISISKRPCTKKRFQDNSLITSILARVFKMSALLFIVHCLNLSFAPT